MVGVVINVKGINKVVRLSARLPLKLTKEMDLAGEEFLKKVQKSAKLRAPRWTGELAKSIHVSKIRRKGNKSTIKLEVGSPYGIFQEFGFTPHWVPLYAPSRSGKGLTVADWAASKGVSDLKFPVNKGSIFVRRHTPFLTPALELGIAELQSIMNIHTNKAIKEAKR